MGALCLMCTAEFIGEAVFYVVGPGRKNKVYKIFSHFFLDNILVSFHKCFS